MPFTIEPATNVITEGGVASAVPETIGRFERLSAEDRLASIWFAYLEMGKGITPAAPGAASMAFAQPTLESIRSMTFREQSQVMCDLVNRSDTPLCRTYATWTPNIKLGFWYRLGEWMKGGIVAPIPQEYELSADASSVLQDIRSLDFAQQITVLRSCVVGMGYAAGIGKSERVAEPVAPPTDIAERTRIAIPGVTHPAVLDYINGLNANDFEAIVGLFAPEGGLQPPFERPIVGRENILQFLREECQGLKLLPERGGDEPAEAGRAPVKVIGRVQTPWFGASVDMNVAWRFFLDKGGKISLVKVELLASPRELASASASARQLAQ